MVRKGAPGALHPFADRGIRGHQHRANGWEIVKKLRRQTERADEPHPRLLQPALSEIHAAKIVAGFRVVRNERQDLLIEASRLVELAKMLELNGLAEQSTRGHLRWERLAVARRAASALTLHGPALLSIH